MIKRSQHKKFIFIAIMSMIITTLMIYWPGLQGPLILDDESQITPILNGIDSNNWSKQYKEYILSTSSILGRPVSMASFMINAYFSGENVWQWKLTNVILHILTGCVIYFLTRRMLSLDKKNCVKINVISIGISSIWLFHPLQVSTVLYLVQRMTILSTFFTLIALLAYINGFIDNLRNNTGIFNLSISLIIFFPIAILSKENSAIFPIYILITTIYILKRKSIKISELSKALKLFNLLMLFLVAIGCISLIIYKDKLILDSYRYLNFTLYDRVLTEPRVLLMYLTQIILPFPSLMGFFHDDFSVSTGLFRPLSTFFCISFFIFYILLIIKFLKKIPLASFGLMFFLTSHLIESTIFPLELVFEHRNYIGIYGILLFFSEILTTIKKNKLIIIISIIIFLIVLTFHRVVKWGDQKSMYEYMKSIHPTSKRLNSIFSDAYANAGQFNNALIMLSKHEGLGVKLHRLVIQCRQTRELKNEELVNLVKENNRIIIDNYVLDKIITLSNMGLDRKCKFNKHGFIELLTNISVYTYSRNNDKQKILIYLAHYHRLIGNNEQAIDTLEKSYSSDMSNPIPLFLMAEWLIEFNFYDESLIVFSRAKKISKDGFYDYSDFIERIELIIEENDSI